MGNYETELRNKNRGYMNLIVWQKAMELFELAWKTAFVEARIDPSEYATPPITPLLHHSITPFPAANA